MPKYTYGQLEALWIQEGGSKAAAPMAAAIAMAESRGESTATNQNTNGTTDRGLWQINSVHGAQSTYDVVANTKSAIAISNNGTDWSPWSTFKNGAYKAFLGSGNLANIPGLGSIPGIGANAPAAAAVSAPSCLMVMLYLIGVVMARWL